MTTCFYTAITNGYDKPTKAPKRCDHTTQLVIAAATEQAEASRWNRYYKIVSPPELAPISVYMDGNIAPAKAMCDMHAWAEVMLADADLAICRHAVRRCAYVEIEACLGRKKITGKQADDAYRMLLDMKLPKNFGLWECGIILRRQRVPWVQELQAEWWNTMQRSGVLRDQIWLPAAINKINGKIPSGRFKTLEMDVRSNPWFTFGKHA